MIRDHLTRLLLCLLLVAAQTARGEGLAPIELLLRTWNTHDGLPQNCVHTIARTRDGFLWLGTNAGLARFDGAYFKSYGLREGLGGVEVRTLLEGRDGTLWIGTLGGGVSALRGGKIERTYTRADGLPSASAIVLAEDSEERLWTGSGGGLARFDGKRFAPVEATPGAGVNALYCDRSGAMWVSFEGEGLWQWKAGQWRRPPSGGPGDASAFCEDAQGRLWMGSDPPQLWCWEPSGWHCFTIPPECAGSYPASLAAAADGTIWFALENGGAYGLREGWFVAPSPRNGGLPHVVQAVYATSDGQVWLGSDSSGVCALASPRTQVVTLPGDGTNDITALLELSPGEFAVGTKGRGFFWWQDGRAIALDEQLDALHYRYGNALLRTRDGSLWVASDAGLCQFRNGRRVERADLAQLANQSIMSLCEDRTDGLWAGANLGKLYRIHEGNVEKVAYGGKLQAIIALVPESDGTLWIGTRGDGVYRLRAGNSRRFGLEDGLACEVVRSLCQTTDGTLWVGTAGGGLAHLEGERFVSISTAEGLPDDVISQIIGDAEGRLWLGSNRGLVAVSERDLKEARPGRPANLHQVSVTHADGLLADECECSPPVAMQDGRIAFPTTRGSVLLRPCDFRPDEPAPAAVIEKIVANGRDLEANGVEITIPPGLERLEIQFTALDLLTQDRLKFRHRLTGMETKWNDAGPQRSVEYRNLAPGHYRFEAAASLGNGLWSAQPAALALTLEPHWWQTDPARAALGAAVLSIVAGLAAWRERVRARRKIAALERRHAVDAERARIARDLHDDVGASLTQVALLSELARGDLQEQPARAAGHIDEIFTTAQEMTRSLDEIVWAVNPAHDTLERFALFLSAFVQSYTRNAGLQIRLDLPETLSSAPLAAPIRHHLYLATKEALHNIVKHAQATEVQFRLSLCAQGFRIRIEDNGRGLKRDDSCGNGEDGLRNVRERLDQLGGRFSFESGSDRGTAIEMEAPLEHGVET